MLLDAPQGTLVTTDPGKGVAAVTTFNRSRAALMGTLYFRAAASPWSSVATSQGRSR